MPRAKSDLQKHTLNFYQGDFDALRRLYPAIEVTKVIREIVHQHRLAEEAKQPEQRVPLTVTE